MGQLARQIQPEEQEGVLASVARFLGRPGFVLRSALRGEFGDAFENAAQFALDLPTGGFLNKSLSLANFLPDSVLDERADLTSREERPEFSDLIKPLGFRPKGLAKLGVDLVGGLATDPLTYLSFGGSGLARGALVGTERAAATSMLRGALSRTPQGRKALLEAGEEVVGEITGGRFSSTKALRDAFKAGDDELGAALREVDARAAEKILEARLPAEALDDAGRLTISGQVAQGEALEAGVRALEKKGLLWDDTAARILGTDVQFLPNFWRRAGRSTVLRPLIPKVPGTALEDMTTLQLGAARAWNWAKGTFFDKKLLGFVPAGLREVAYRVGFDRGRRDVAAADTVKALFGDLTAEQRSTIGRIWHEAHEAYQSGASRLVRETASDEATEFALRTQVRHEALERIADEAGMSYAEASRLMGGFDKAMQEIQGELVKLGVWPKAVDNPFYLPLQAGHDVAEYMARGADKPAFMKDLRNAFANKTVKGLKDVFTRRRKHETVEAFQETLREVARKHGVDVPEEGLVLTDIGDLMSRRLLAHNRTVERVTLFKEATERFGLRKGDDVDRYVRAVLEPLRPRGTLEKVLGGGTLKIPTAGGKVREVPWAGLNFYLKAPLTILFPAFHMRNMTSAVYMSFLDPDIGWEGAKGMFRAMRDGRLVKTLGGNSGSEQAKILQALWEPTEEAMDALAGITVGNYTAREIVSQARGVVTSDNVAREILDEVPGLLNEAGKLRADDLLTLDRVLKGDVNASTILNQFKKTDRGRLRGYLSVIKAGRDMASLIEDSFRLQGYMGLIKKGLTPTEAARRVNRAYVDYAVQSGAERLVRDLIPFARFSLANTPVVLKEAAQRPQILAPFLQVQRSATGDEQNFLPEHVRNTAAIPFGDDAEGNPKFLTGLGLPFEQALANLGSVTPTGFRRQVLGALNPAIKTPLEAAANRSFYFGSEFGDFKRAPRFLPQGFPGVREFVTKEGKTLREVPGWVNAWLVGALPSSRFASTLDKWFDENKGFLDKVLDTATGAKVYSVDQKRQARKAIEQFLSEAADRGEIGLIENFYARGGEEVPDELQAALQALKQLRKR